MTSTKEVVVELKTGERYGVSTAAQAKKLYPNARIVSYGDGRPFEDPAKPARTTAKPKSPRPSRKTAASKAPDTVPVTTADDPATVPQDTGDAADQG